MFFSKIVIVQLAFSGIQQDAQHAAQRFCSAPKQLIANREGANILWPHG
jgi:hypothetical protein